MSSQNVPATGFGTNKNETGMTFRAQRSHLSVIRGLMEETAIVKAMLSVLLPVLYEHKKASQFNIIFKDAFPLACQFPLFQQYIEEGEKKQLKDAVAEELQKKHFQPDTEIINTTLTLYQTLKFSQTVLLIGPTGCGKTTCYCALAVALNSLAANAVEYEFENGHMVKGDTLKTDSQISNSNWNFVDSMVLFPNAMSHEEIFGCLCAKRGWQDGALTRVLRDSEQRENVCSKLCTNDKKTPIVKWLVLDGEPVGQPGWLDYLTSLSNPEDPFLFLSSGERLAPSRLHFKLLIEVTDLSEASPSAVTRCSLVHVRATDLWKAVWKSEIDVFYSEHRLDQGTFKMWNNLAEDLFARTLSFLRQNPSNSTMHIKNHCGLQEIMSFVRILRALLQQFGKEEGKTQAVPQRNSRDIDVPCKHESLARDLFLVAYIWGFGGHLHPCHWPHFDLLVREVLFNCRYKIVVPDTESVFEHFFSINNMMCPKNTLLTTSITPKYGKYTYLLNLMLEANQTVLLAGEPGSGKTTLCQTLLNFDKPHINLPGSPLLSSKALRNILNNISCQKYCKANLDAAVKQPRLLLFVDDLHEAPCDVFGRTSMALESLRESMSRGEILTVDTYCFKLLNSRTMDYMVTCCVSGLGGRLNNVLWMHECIRTFSDRLCSEDETRTLGSLIAKVATAHFGIRLVEEAQPDSNDIPHVVTSHANHTLSTETAGMSKQTDQCPETLSPSQEPEPAGQSELKKDNKLTKPSLLLENILSEEASLKALQLIEDVMAQFVYGPEILESLNSLDQQHNFKHSSSYSKQDLDALLQKLSDLIDRKEEGHGHHYENNYNTSFRYVVNRQRVSQLFHVLRALLIPGGHGVLIGSDKGTGRKTTVRLAAYLTGYQLMEVHCGNENKLHEILKEAGNQTRVNGGNVIILVHEEINQSVREELLVAMAHRTYPALCTDEELRSLISKVTAVNYSRKYLMDSWMFERYLSQVHRNVHVFLLMSLTMPDISETLAYNGTSGLNGQLTKALSLSCCVELYKPWTNQSLLEVAAQCLSTSPHKIEREGSKASQSVVMAGIHQSAYQYASVLLRAQPFGPHTYMDFIAHFVYMCNHLHKHWHGQADRVAYLLAHLDEMNTTAENFKHNLKRLQDKVAETQQYEQQLLRAIDDQKRLIEETEEKYVVEENKLHHLEEQINQAQIEERPIFQAGLKILKCLNPSDLEEVRHYRDPPDGVVKIMDAICLLFNQPPGWESSKQLLGQSNFFQELEFFDRYSVTNEQLQKLSHIVHSPQFVPESVREVSKACESLCRWVQALYECCCMQHQLSVKQQLEVQAREVRGQLHLAKQHKENACNQLDDVELQLLFIQNDLEEQLLELHKYKSMEEKATRVDEQVKIQVRHWNAAAKEADLHKQNIPGDALILAAIIAYLGPFAPDIRTELLSKWRELCQTGHININPNDPRTTLFTHPDPVPSYFSLGFPISVSERLQQPLGRALGLNDWQLQDTASARLLVQLLLWSYRSVCDQHWPLLADTQQHSEMGCQSWLTTAEYAKLETEYGMVVSADDSELLEKLDQAAEKGLKVLVTHVEHAVPSPEFLSRLVRSGKKHVQPSHPGFCLFLSTQLPVRLLSNEIHPTILAQVHVVDLSLSSEEIQELMLTQLLQSECKQLLIQHLRFQNEKHLLQEKLFKEQDALVNFILQSNTSLLQESDFLPSMTVHQEAIKKLQTGIQQLSEELEYHETLVAAPRKLVRLAAALYQALQDVSRLSPAYYFSLHSFIAVMQEAFIVKGKSLASHTFAKVLVDIVPEITNRMVAQVLAQYRPCLFRSHVAVLKLLVSVALLQYNGDCSEGERMALLRGLQDINNSVTNVQSSPPSHADSQLISSLPNWIPAHVHPELLCLENIPSFRGLITSLSASPMQWQEYLHFPSSTVTGAVPCRSHSHLSLLQRALLWKTMVPNCLEGLAEALAACHLCCNGQITEFPHTGDPEALSHYIIKYEGPIILALPSARGNSRTSIQPLYLINKMAHFVEQTKKVQVKVISLGALCKRDVILSVVDKAVNNGHWLVFNDCHLLGQWDNKVVAHLSQLSSTFKDERHLVHPCFRLWFITQEHATYSIPASLRMCALPLVCDSPLDLKEELSCSLRHVASIIHCQSLLGDTADNMKLLLSCAIFHSVILQRQTYKYSGQGRIYDWNQEDLQALVDAHNCIASLCHNKIKALQYIAVNLVHGGHVLDSADLEVVGSVAKTFLSRLPPLCGSGAKILSNFISNPGHFDLSGLLRILGQGLPDLANTSDPLMLRFSDDVAAEIIKINSHNLNILLQASQTPLGRLRHFYTQLNKPSLLPTYTHARDRLEALKKYLTAANLASTVRNAGAVPHSPLRDFLQDEWDDLIDLVSSVLSQLQQPIQYSTLTFDSLLKLNDLSRLERRAELLSAYLWHHNISDPPGAYRLSAFKNGRGFLVAVIREAAQVNCKYISDIELHFQVLNESTYPASLPLDAVYLCGLELRGASWNTQLRALKDTVFLQPYLMPLVCLKAQVRSTNIAQHTNPCKSSYLTDTTNVQLTDASTLIAPQLPVYYCPLYLDEERDTGDWKLADAKIITKIPLHACLNPELCSLRRVRLVSTL
uniref:AAA+ ATPase domain-containing protein n=1 Tax=Anabas testudineus TaxID=64144 RepID=A0AAQ6IG98_ANATE